MSVKMETKELAEKTDLCVLKVMRDSGGLKIYAKSPVYEEFFLKTSGGEIKTNERNYWADGSKYYEVKKASIPRAEYNQSINLQHYCYCNIIDSGNGRLDFSFIRTVGIKDGIEFSVKGMYLEDEISDFVKDFTTFTKKFFSSYVKKISMEVTISSTI